MLPIALRPEGVLLRVLDAEGEPVPFWFELMSRVLALQERYDTLQQDNSVLQQDNEAKDRRIAELQAELERLQHPPQSE